ncbi:MAG: hypothetical protein JW765_00685 [Deltaproteobacteria bacterium]|nr:hypothetical protein [Candidatus Zymogenaceae bacterium]
MGHTCRRCSQEIPEGGLYYHVKLSAVSGYDGFIDLEHEAAVSAIADEISGKSSEALEEDVYFEREVILCSSCRKAVIETFCEQLRIDGGPDKAPGDLLH